MKGKPKITNLFNSRLSAPCSEEEKRLMEEWRSVSDAEADEALLHDVEKMQAIEKEMLAGINERIDRRVSQGARTRSFFLQVAASVALCCAVGLFIYYYSGSAGGNYITTRASGGEVRKVTLPDGSVLWLNAGSTVKYPDRFGDTRNVTLVNGEAFFDICRDEEWPFLVQTGGLTIKVLGTSFNVKSFNGLDEARVTVASGRVQVANSSDVFGTFTRNDELIFNKASGSHSTRVVESDNVIKWRQGDINLYEVPFLELILALEQAYGVNITYDPARFATCRTTIRFRTTDDLDQVLDMVKAIYGLSYQRKEGKEVILQIDQKIQPCM